jgi:hypothetical protein
LLLLSEWDEKFRSAIYIFTKKWLFVFNQKYQKYSEDICHRFIDWNDFICVERDCSILQTGGQTLNQICQYLPNHVSFK